MKKLAILFCLIFWLGSGFAEEKPILQKVDEFRSLPDKNFFILLNLSSGDEESRKLEVYTDKAKNLVRFLEPQKEKGRLMLKEDVRSLWLMIPGNKRLVRISQTQRLLGLVSIGDVLSVRFSLDYRVEEQKKDETDPNQLFLSLKPKTAGSQYGKILLWIDSKNYRPIQSKHFVLSGKQTKTLIYQEYKKFNGQWKVSKILVKDELFNKPDSVIEYLNYAPVELPPNFYTKETLQSL